MIALEDSTFDVIRPTARFRPKTGRKPAGTPPPDDGRAGLALHEGRLTPVDVRVTDEVRDQAVDACLVAEPREPLRRTRSLQRLLVHVLADRQPLSTTAGGREQGSVRKDRRKRASAWLDRFDGNVAVGWCQLTPRHELPWLDRTWRLRRVDEEPVWALSCLYVRKGYRRRGITSALIRAAVNAARRAGAPALEAYPFDADVSPSATGTGYASTFARLGFETVARRVPARPIMRFDLRLARRLRRKRR